MYFIWLPTWKRGDDPDLAAVFESPNKKIREFKQTIYNNLVKDLKNKEYYSFANIDNYIKLPFLPRIFVMNLTVIQMGPGLVYVFLKNPIFTALFCQYLQPKEQQKNILVHDMYATWWLPYWMTSAMLRMEGAQVTNDMYIWDSKKFGHKFHCKENEAD